MSEQLRTFVDLNPEFEVPVERLATWLARLDSPVGRGFSIVALLFALYHTYTWFEVTPKAMPLAVNGKKVPGSLIVLGHWAGFIVASAVIWLFVAG